MVKSVRLADISSLITKGTTPTTLGFDYQENGINFLKIECFEDNGTFIPEKVTHISSECHDKLKRSQLQSGDILFSIAGAIGRVSIVTEEMLPANTNQALAIIRIDNPEVYVPYVKLILQSPVIKKQFERKKQGVAQLNLSLNDINGLTIPLTNFSQQIEYVQLFDRIESIIANRKQELQSLDDLIKARFVEMFGDPETGKSIYATNKLKELSVKISDGVHAKPDYTNSGRPFLSVVNINKKKIDFSDCKYVSEEAYQKMIKSTHPEKGDILYTKVGATYGIPAYVDTDTKFCLYVSVCLIKPNHEKINSRFLAMQMDMPFVKHQADKRIKGIGVPDLHLNQIGDFDIICPPRQEQDVFVAFVEQIDKSKFAVQKALEKGQLLFDSLTQQFFG